MKTLLAFVLALAPSLALAHVGVGETTGVAHGFMHPVSGFDHILAMVAVGLFAAHLGGRALWLVPLSFVAMMAFGGVLGMAGIGLAYVEVAIGLSVVVLGIIVAARVNPPVAIAMALVGFFAIFHGHAHGAEMPETASGLAYGVGFILATALLHAIGIGVGILIGKAGQRYSRTISQIAGGAMALAGVAMLGGII
ncbi:MAG: urease accessory protein [Methylobacteriaceae bacterium]|jgi:urease accessory protein|nr:urease accessory protein [Methylobacteriaceae bacterium]